MGVLFGTEIHQYWWENNAKSFAVSDFFLANESIAVSSLLAIFFIKKFLLLRVTTVLQTAV